MTAQIFRFHNLQTTGRVTTNYRLHPLRTAGMHSNRCDELILAMKFVLIV